MHVLIGLGAVAALIGLATALCAPAQAKCRWALVDGQQHELCDNAGDLGGLPSLTEFPNLPTLRPLEPLPPLPPLGARECHQAEVQLGQRSAWLEVCPTDNGRLLLPAR